MVRFFLFSIFIIGFSTAGLAEDLFEVEHIWLTQDIHASGEGLCQDGQYIYFKNRDECLLAMESSSCESLRVTPIHFIERINLPSGEGVTRFYSVKTTYDYLRYELTSTEPIINYDLVESKQLPIPMCQGRKPLPEKKVRRIRRARNNERSFVQGLVNSGVTVLNSPFGRLNPSIWGQSGGFWGDSPDLRSPLCNREVDYKDIMNKASGEWSGNGVVSVQSLSEWHENSYDLYIKKTKGLNNKDQYHFFCRGEGDNE